jgi:16S rRNA (cytosine967-C5)-methyltransferase
LELASLVLSDGLDCAAIEAACTDGPHALGALTVDERRSLVEPRRSTEPWITLNYPQWLHGELAEAFGDDLSAEMTALNARAPLDLRVNALKARRDDMLKELRAAGLDAERCSLAEAGIRLARADAQITKLASYVDGRIEIQDEASQIAVAEAQPAAGEVVVDLAAGAGGKTLALAAMMGNRGRILACDIEPARLRRMEPRVARAGATIVEIVGDPYGGAISTAVGEGADLVFVDAPCSGTGTWRRNPETKWTLDRERLAAYRQSQTRLLNRAAELAKPTGRIAYAVCSILPAEGPEQIGAFVTRKPSWRPQIERRLTPARDATDGFYVAVLTQAR